MFNSIILRKSLPRFATIDIGLLAECLLFYDKVRVIAEMSTLNYMARHLGLDVLEELINQEHLILDFSPFISATHAKAEFTSNECFDYCYVTKVSGENKEPDFEALFFEMLQKGSGKKGKSRRVGNRIFQKINIIEPRKIAPIEKGVTEIARQNIQDDAFLSSATKTILQYLAPKFTLPPDWHIKTIRHENGFNLLTNINFQKLNKLRSKIYFPDSKSELTRAYFLDTFLKANEDLFFSTHFKSELVTNPLTSSLIELNLSNIINKTNINIKSLDLFQQVLLPESKTIREVINNGEKQFADIIPLLKKSKKFKNWLQKQEGDKSSIIKEYYQSITEKSWIDKLPNKITRFSLFTGAGFIADTALTSGVGSLVSLALNAGDTFFLEKLVDRKWKPDQYVNELCTFVK